MKMKRTAKILVLAFALVSSASCKSAFELLLESNDVDAKYKAAFEYLDQKKYDKSSQLFESLAMLTNGTERDDTVRYYWGFSNYSNKDYFTAETNFSNFLQDYPRSPFAEPAQFLRIDCLFKSTLRWELDQMPTYKALTAINEYLLTHDSGANVNMCRKMQKTLEDRLDKKAFENAKLYYTMEDYKAARVAFRNILKDDADNIYREQILYYTALSSYRYALLSVKQKQQERYLVFRDDYLNFIGEFPESSKRKELDNLYEKSKQK